MYHWTLEQSSGNHPTIKQYLRAQSFIHRLLKDLQTSWLAPISASTAFIKERGKKTQRKTKNLLVHREIFTQNKRRILLSLISTQFQAHKNKIQKYTSNYGQFKHRQIMSFLYCKTFIFCVVAEIYLSILVPISKKKLLLVVILRVLYV